MKHVDMIQCEVYFLWKSVFLHQSDEVTVVCTSMDSLQTGAAHSSYSYSIGDGCIWTPPPLSFLALCRLVLSGSSAVPPNQVTNTGHMLSMDLNSASVNTTNDAGSTFSHLKQPNCQKISYNDIFTHSMLSLAVCLSSGLNQHVSKITSPS